MTAAAAVACRVCESPHRAEIDALLADAPNQNRAWLTVRDVVAGEPVDTRPGKPAVQRHYNRGHHLGQDVDRRESAATGSAADDVTAEQIAAKARRLLNDKLDSLPAKDLKDIVVEQIKLDQAREKTKQIAAAKKAGKGGEDDPALEAREAVARALHHRRDGLRVVGLPG